MMKKTFAIAAMLACLTVAAALPLVLCGYLFGVAGKCVMRGLYLA